MSGLLTATPILETLTKFSDDTSEKIITFGGGGGTDTSASIEIPKKAVVTGATFNVSTVPDASGNYPSKPYIDVGDNSDTDWAFTGTGYGTYGMQDVFSDNQYSKGLNFGASETFKNDSSFYMPKNATVSSAGMRVSSFNLQNITVTFGTSTWGNWIPFWGSNWNSCRFQALYYNSSINYQGTISKIFFKPTSSNSKTARFENFTVRLCKTKVTTLTGTFNNNYGGYTPVIVYNGTFTTKFTNGKWFEIDVDDTFYYDNSTHFLVEIRWNGDNGVGTPLECTSAKYNSRAWSSSWTSTGGSSDSTGYHITLGFGGGIAKNVTIDIGANGGTPEFNHTGELNETKIVPDFTTEVNSLISSLPISFTDDYGNQFVEIPVNVTNELEGTLLLSDLDIRYNLTSMAFLNPHNGNLVNELNSIIPDTGEGNITIPFKVVSGSAGKINISNISIAYFSPELSNDRLLVSNSHGAQNICYADYENYTVMVNITNKMGISDVNNVTLFLDIDRELVTVNWTRATDSFIEVYDPKNLITLNTGNCVSTPIGVDRWNLEFNIRFGWSFPDDIPINCALNTTNNSGDWIYNSFDSVFQLENDLEFTGTLDVDSQFQGVVTSGDWVRASEVITWSNLTVVYEGTTNFYPADKNFNVTITDDDTGSWMDSSSSGNSFNIQTVVDAVTDKNDIHSINITEIPGNGVDVSPRSFLIKVDADGPFAPPNILCHSDSTGGDSDYDDDAEIYVTWDLTGSIDPDSGVKEYAMEYADPLPTDIKSWGSTATGQEGLSMFYVRARDNVGNWGTSGSANIFIDLTLVTFTSPFPEPDVWQNSITVDCGITIKDTSGSGVDNDTIYYKYVDKGSVDLGTWHKYRNAPPSGETVQCNVPITFDSDGAEKKVKWRARDMAGNELTDENYYGLKIDSTPPAFEDFTFDFNSWHRTLSPVITFNVKDLKPENDVSSGVDINTIKYQMSTDGTDNYGQWIPIVPIDMGENKRCTVNPTFVEGNNNFIRFTGKDIAGNEITTNDYRLKLDVSDPEYSKPVPVSTVWMNSTAIQCNITISDEYSKVNVESVRYSISTNGTEHYGKWKLIGIKHLNKNVYFTVILTINDTFLEGENNYIRWWAHDVAGNNITSPDYLIRIDVTGCRFSDSEPAEDTWINYEIVGCSIIINDTSGSGIDISSIEYATSNSGIDDFGKWSRKNLEVLDLTSGSSRANGPEDVHYMVQASAPVYIFLEGSDNYVQWRVRDLAGNEYTYGGPYNIRIDLTLPDFYNPMPIPNTVQIELEQTCKITIRDDENGSGINPSSVEYRYSTAGKDGYFDWTSFGLSQKKLTGGYQFITYINFNPGSLNYLQWRVTDIAGNGPVESTDYKIVINSPPVPIITSPKHSNAQPYDFTTEDDIIFNARKTYDPDGVDVLTYYWESNLTGPLGTAEYFQRQLGPGMHEITLFVADGHNHNESTSVSIILVRYLEVKDTDGDGIADFKDPDIDNDGHLNDKDAFPEDKREWLDTDHDGFGNNMDPDDDGDEVPDEEDAFPLDKKRWKEEPADQSWMIYAIAVVIVIVIILVLLFFIMSSKKKKAAAEKEAAEPAVTTTTPTVPTVATQQTLPLQTAPTMQPQAQPQQPLAGMGTGMPMAPQSLYMPMQLKQIPMLPPMSTGMTPPMQQPLQQPQPLQQMQMPRPMPMRPMGFQPQPQMQIQPQQMPMQPQMVTPTPQPQPQFQQAPASTLMTMCQKCRRASADQFSCPFCGANKM
jgi:hypothetical protein